LHCSFTAGWWIRPWVNKEAANEYDNYERFVFPLFFIWESGIWEVLAHHLPLVFAETIFGRIVSHATDLVSSKIPTGAQGAPGSAQFSSFEASLNMADTNLENIEVTSADVDAFMTAIKNDEKIQQEAVPIARTSQSVDSLLATTATSNSLQLSPRTYLSPDVVSAIQNRSCECLAGARDFIFVLRTLA
jgi:hypothetical protein